jgi:hypothetical protein
MALTNKPHLVLRLKKEYSYTFVTCSRVKFVFTLFANVPIRFTFYDAVSVQTVWQAVVGQSVTKNWIRKEAVVP